MRRCRKPGGFAAGFGFLRRLPAAGGRCAAGLWAGVRQESRWGPVGSVESAPARAPSAMGLVRQVDGGADALPTLPTGNAGVAAAGVESVGSAHASRQYGGWSSATRRGARAPFPPFPHQSPCGERWAWRMGPRRAGRHRAVRRRPSRSDQGSSGRTGCDGAPSRTAAETPCPRCSAAVGPSSSPASFNFRL